MPATRKRLVLGLIAMDALLLFAAAAAPLQAREKIYLGAGIVRASASGDLKGVRSFSDDPTTRPIVFPGKLEDGGGLTLLGGAMVLDWLGLELELNATRHDSAHSRLPTDSSLPREQIDADLFSLVAAARFLWAVTDSWEVFGRIGLGGHTLSYDENTTVPGNNVVRLDSELSGVGLMAGVGTAILFGPVGIELSVSQHEVTFSHLTTEDEVDSFPDTDMSFTKVSLTLFVHFSPK